jgi:hypothetical protein
MEQISLITLEIVLALENAASAATLLLLRGATLTEVKKEKEPANREFQGET